MQDSLLQFPQYCKLLYVFDMPKGACSVVALHTFFMMSIAFFALVSLTMYPRCMKNLPFMLKNSLKFYTEDLQIVLYYLPQKLVWRSQHCQSLTFLRSYNIEASEIPYLFWNLVHTTSHRSFVWRSKESLTFWGASCTGFFTQLHVHEIWNFFVKVWVFVALIVSVFLSLL